MSYIVSEPVCEVVICGVTPKSIRHAAANAIGGPDALAHQRDGAYMIEIDAYTVEDREAGSRELQPECGPGQAPHEITKLVVETLAGMIWGSSRQVSNASCSVWQRGNAPHCYMRLAIHRVTNSASEPYRHLDDVCGACIGMCPICGQECGRIL